MSRGSIQDNSPPLIGVNSMNYGYSSSLSYPAPFLNYEKHLVPNSYKMAAELLIHHFFTDGNVNSAVEVMSVYSITDFMFSEDPKEEIRKKWESIAEKKKFKSFNKRQGLDYFLLGMCASSVFKPFIRKGNCIKCGLEYNLNSPLTNYIFKGLEFRVLCKKCKSRQKLINLKDTLIMGAEALKKISLIKWNIFNLEPRVHFLSEAKQWRYNIPRNVQEEIMKGEKWFIEQTPLDFIEAVQAFKAGRSGNKCAVDLDEDRIIVMQRPMPSMPNGEMLGFGMPIAISALRELLFKNTIRRAQSVILYENILPFRIFSPQQTSQDPTFNDNAAWVASLQNNYQLWRKNPQHISITAIPVNIQQAGGDGKILSMFPEMQLLNKEIKNSMNVPAGLLEGEMTFSGGSVALRIFENTLINYTSDLNESNNFHINEIADVIRLEPVKMDYMPFKTGDDPQMKQLLANATQSNWMSKDSYLRTLGYDYASEQIKVAKEMKKEQITSSSVQAQAQMMAQKIMEYLQSNQSDAMGNTQMPIEPEQIEGVAKQLQLMEPEKRQQAMEQINQQNPELGKEIKNVNSLSPSAGIDFMTDLAKTSPDLAQQRVDALKIDDPIKAEIVNQVSGAMSMYNQNGIVGPAQQQGIDMRPQPVQKPPMRNYFK
jgi:hypothetical protein